ncbi:hypothetical protein BJ741DRAFT_601617 [Chytriomyces cf. hyalinus JEL632]|nr:hypothetical protein BJ741DRAFT_601617 [Chytriomyces cf. hyalinus JEL632]
MRLNNPTAFRVALALTTLNALLLIDAQPADDCVFDPSKDRCVGFVLEDHLSVPMLADVCSASGDLTEPACTLKRLCSAQRISSDALQDACAPFSLLSTACKSVSSAAFSTSYLASSSPTVKSNPSSNGCRTYYSLCRPSSLVQQCSVQLNSIIPTLNKLTIDLADACKITPSAKGCQLCQPTSSDKLSVATKTTANPECKDPLTLYNSICAEFPENTACEASKLVCSHLSGLQGLACASPKPAPTLVPYLHTAFTQDHVLFEWARPKSSMDAILACSLAFAIAMVYEFSMALRRVWELDFKAQLEAQVDVDPVYPVVDTLNERGETGDGVDDDISAASPEAPLLTRMRVTVGRRVRLYSIIIARQVRVRFWRSFVKAVEGICLVGVVLLCASFNSALCGAVILGLAVGAFLFGGW